MNSLQRLFEDAEYFCLKLRILLSAILLLNYYYHKPIRACVGNVRNLLNLLVMHDGLQVIGLSERVDFMR